ncbi:unnamed protein product [Urochloa decumbens]|uniref:Retrotransposon Copia-like N-terminal domain-containing protein n=1 Tax=Urochloa decumbens TaxID=240449 RepID=A0ABC9BR32_9POAL
MATFPIKPLDGEDGYLRWKESMLLALNTAGVAHVLSDDPPPAPAPSRAAGDGGADQAASKKQWARDYAVCRGHILAALSDRLLPVYMRHGTARALWEAVARTYEPDSSSWELMFEELEFGDDETLRERVARAEALAIAKYSFPEPPSDQSVAYYVCTKLPDVAKDAITRGYGTTMSGYTSMSGLWRSALEIERIRNTEARFAIRRKMEGGGKSGHVAKKRRR